MLAIFQVGVVRSMFVVCKRGIILWINICNPLVFRVTKEPLETRAGDLFANLQSEDLRLDIFLSPRDK